MSTEKDMSRRGLWETPHPPTRHMGLTHLGVKQAVSEMKSSHPVSHFTLGVGESEEASEIHAIDSNERTRDVDGFGPTELEGPDTVR